MKSLWGLFFLLFILELFFIHNSGLHIETFVVDYLDVVVTSLKYLMAILHGTDRSPSSGLFLGLL